MKVFIGIISLLCIILLSNLTKAALESEAIIENEIENNNGIDSMKLKLVIDELQNLLNSGKATEAFEIIQKLDPLYRQEETVLISYGRALVQLGKGKEGQAVFETILQKNPSSIDANLLMAKLNMRQLSWDTVELYVMKVLQVDPQNAMAHSYMSKVILNRDNDTNKALSYISKAVKLDPHHAEIQFDLGMMLFSVGRFTEGQQAFEETTRLGPALAQTASIVNVYVQYGQFEWAIEALEQVNFVVVVVHLLFLLPFSSSNIYTFYHNILSHIFIYLSINRG